MAEFGRACISVADESGLLLALVAGAKTAEQLADGKSIPSVDGILKALVAQNVLTMESPEKYALTPYGRAYFVKGSLLYRRNQLRLWRDAPAHKRILKMLENGWDPISSGDRSYTEMWEQGSITQEAAERFTGMMHINIAASAISAARSGIFSEFRHVMDVAGGSGIFLAALKQRHPETQATLLELTQVCEEAKKLIASHVDPETLNYFSGNMFTDPWPNTADAIFLSNILHDWSYAKGDELLSNAWKALPSRGAVFINECLLDSERTSPTYTVLFNLLMQMNHRSQQYTEQELSASLTRAGFVNPRVVFRFGYYSVVRADKP